MDIETLLTLAKDLVLAKTDKPLTDLQEAILRGTVKGDTYYKIAEDTYNSEPHVRDTGSKLFQILSKELGKKFTKKNFRLAIKKIDSNDFRKAIIKGDFTASVVEGNVTINNRPICHNLNRSVHCFPSSQQTKLDLKNAPLLTAIYGRTDELNTLTEAIASNTHLITIYGLVGMGKTALIRTLIEQIQNQFDYVLWYNLETLHTTSLPNTPNFTDFQTRFNNLISPEKNDTPLIDYCQNYPCLIILDNFHHLFTPKELAGKYLPATEKWQQFLQQIITLSHQSCLIIISQELPKEIDEMTNDYTHIKTLALNGLDTDTTSQMLGKIDSCIDFSLHQGHPAYIKSMALMHKKLGQNNLEILAKKAPIFPQDLQLNFDQAFQRLSDIEQQIILILARENYPINVAQLLENINISSTELANALQSLMRRCWVIQDDNDLIVSAIVRIYLIAK